MQVSFPKCWERAPGQMRSILGQRKEDIGLLMCNEAEPKNLLKTKEKQQVNGKCQMQPWICRYYERDNVHSRPRHTRDSISWIHFLCNLAEFQTTVCCATLDKGSRETPHLSVSLCFCTMVLEVEEVFKTALDMREGFGLPPELSDHTHSCLVSLVPSVLTGTAVRRGQGQVSED